jgi:hypothetical protein
MRITYHSQKNRGRTVPGSCCAGRTHARSRVARAMLPGMFYVRTTAVCSEPPNKLPEIKCTRCRILSPSRAGERLLMDLEAGMANRLGRPWCRLFAAAAYWRPRAGRVAIYRSDFESMHARKRAVSQDRVGDDLQEMRTHAPTPSGGGEIGDRHLARGQERCLRTGGRGWRG